MSVKQKTPFDPKSLYFDYNAGKLVLILGSDLLRTNIPENSTFEQEAIKSIVELIGNNTELANGIKSKTFSDLAIEFPESIISTNRINGIYKGFSDNAFDTSLIKLIANLPKIKMFIQTSFDTKLKEELQKISDENPKHENAETIVWNHKSNRPVYIDTTKRYIFHLFGNINEGVSVFEDEQIDCLINLSVSNEANKSTIEDHYSFLEYLKDKTLVFLGNNFPDWFMRLMIRTLYNSPITYQEGKAYIVNNSERGLSYEKYFFDKFNIQLIHEFPIEKFLTDLQETILVKEGFQNFYKPKKVFISYYSGNAEYAKDLKDCLNLKHIDAFLDAQNMGIAEHEKKIEAFIRAKETCIFVCILSKELIEKEEKDSYVKRIEWKIAEGRYMANKFLSKNEDGVVYPPFIIVPVAIDKFDTYRDLLPEFITANSIIPIEKACKLIEDTIKNIEYEY